MTKFYYVLSSLDTNASVRVAPLLDILPDIELWALLKNVYGLLTNEWPKAYYDLTDLGDWRPSEMMDYIV